MTNRILKMAIVGLIASSLYAYAEDDLTVLRQKAEQGDAVAQFDLGKAYGLGEGVLRNHEEAFKWICLAAEQGYARAQSSLGAAYNSGIGVPQNYKESVRWYRLAAEQGDARAQFCLGVACYAGKGVSQDDKEYVRWIHLAAKQGDADAQFSLGRAYGLGEGISQNYKEAYGWIRLAAEQGNVKARVYLGEAYNSGIGIPQDYKESVKWYRLAAEQGDATAQVNLGWAYYVGDGISEDHVEAMKWFRLAEKQGHEGAGKLIEMHENDSVANKHYSSNLLDMQISRSFVGIGDLGSIQTIIDLRSFVPLSAWSTKREKEKIVGTDCFQWFKLPVKEGICHIYYGEMGEKYENKMSQTKILTEKELAGDNLKWGELSYEIAQSSGEELFKAAGGWLGFEGAEPIAVILTEHSAIIVMSFKYSDLMRHGHTGQILCGYEFSRKTKNYKTHYHIYSTLIFPRSAKDAFSVSLPFINAALKVFGGWSE